MWLRQPEQRAENSLMPPMGFKHRENIPYLSTLIKCQLNDAINLESVRQSIHAITA